MRDEFGREIPGRGSGIYNHQNHHHPPHHHHHNSTTRSSTDPPPNEDHNTPFQSSSPPQDYYYSTSTTSALTLNQSLSSSRYSSTSLLSVPNTHPKTSSSGGGGVDRGRPSPPLPFHSSRHPNQHQQHGLSSSSSCHPTPTTTTVTRTHPSFQYTTKPLLCQFRFQEEQQQDTEQDKNHPTTNTTNTVAATVASSTPVINHDDTAYHEYRQQYCLTYIRCFFNTHLDAPWFRYMYSPYHIYHTLQQSRYQSQLYMELQPLKSILQHVSSLLLLSPDEDDTATTTPFQNYMEEHVRLWERRTFSTPHCNNETTDHHPSSVSCLETPRAHLLSFQRAATTMTSVQDNDTLSTTTNKHPPLDTATTNPPVESSVSALHITDIPTHMSDTHILIALRDIIVALYTPKPPPPTTNNNNNTDDTVPTAAAAAVVVAPPPPLLLQTPMPQVQIWPSQQMILQKGNIYHYMRDVIVTGPTDTIQAIVQYLSSSHHVTTMTPSTDRTDIPRKQPGPVHSTTLFGTTGRTHVVDPTSTLTTTTTYYPLEVECTDLYGRDPTELYGSDPIEIKKPKDMTIETVVDTPTTSTTTTTDKDAITKQEDANTRKHVVLISLLPLHNGHNCNKNSSNHHRNSNNNAVTTKSPTTKNVTVRLSAALSSTERIEYDTYAAYQIAMALDDLYHIPEGYRIHDLLNDCDERVWSYQSSDKLDFIIAYLRRVHLFSYYNGCCFVNHSLCDVATGKHAVSTIHVRMKNADAFIQEQQQNDPSSSMDHTDTPVAPRKDLLVQRLDDAIAKALHEYCGITEPGDTYHNAATRGDHPPMTIAAERQAQLEQEAKGIQDAQDVVQQQWLVEHAGRVDPDGRARCSSFLNCGKLFKDSTFLCKHLLKKHSEHLHAEQAKCHDAFMMKAWESVSERPVPYILVDCGKQFGTVPCPVVGTIPTCIDPEPKLWSDYLERRQRLEDMELRRLEQRNQNKHQHQQQQSSVDEHPYKPMSQPPQRPPPRVNNFVDVDDMKVEKVEVSFDNVVVPDVASTMAITNKKKKRKLL